MKLPSIKKLVSDSLITFKRFPAVLVLAIISSVTTIILVEFDEPSPYGYLFINLAFIAVLGISLFTAVKLITERKKLSLWQQVIVHAIGIALLTVYYFILPKEFGDIDGIRYFLIVLALHLFVAFIAFLNSGTENGFWQFNKTLFLNFLVSALYAFVLFCGIALAILAIDQLFNANIRGKVYLDLFIVIAGVFNTWFFLAGFPENLDELDQKSDYPKGLKVFTQYILLPLVTLYLVILYAYLLKIFISWELPVGWVSYLVLGFSIAGIFSLLLVHPIKNEESEKWIKIFSRWFYRALFPLIILFFVAIGKRVSEYGITENRYFIIVLALLLAGISVYFLISKVKNIKVIPISLAITAFLTCFGPWGAFYISKTSQYNRLEKILTDNQLLKNGKIQSATKTYDLKTRQQISSIVRYLCRMHGHTNLQPLFSQNLDSFKTTDKNQVDLKILKLMNIEYVSEFASTDSVFGRFSYFLNQEKIYPLKPDTFQCLVYMNYFAANKSEPSKRTYISGKDTFEVSYLVKESQIVVTYRKEKLLFPLNKTLTNLNKKYGKSDLHDFALKDFEITSTGKTHEIKFQITGFSGEKDKSTRLININNLNGLFFIKEKLDK